MTSAIDWKIIIIDDEKDIRDVMTITLEDANFKVFSAENGQSGVQLCREISPQIVITDIRMPKMNGIQVLETLKSMNPDIEVIVITAFGEMDVAIQALQLDASDFITKPINDEALHMALKRAKQRYLTRKEIKDYTTLLEKEKSQTSQELINTIFFQKNLVENSIDGILGCDENEIVITFNNAMERMLGYSKDIVLNKMSFHQFFSAEERQRFNSEIEKKSYGGVGKLFLYETTLLNHEGHKVPVQVSATVLSNEESGDGLVCFFRDLREISELEREIADQARILHQDKMMSLGRLAASVVHEINNPLFGVLNYLQLMSRKLERSPLNEMQGEKFKQYLELAEKETSRCSQIISSLLTFSRKSPPSFDRLNIDELLDRCAILCQHKLELSNIELHHSVDPQIPSALGDFNQLQQCLFNLIFNAIDAMPDGGTIDIESKYDKNKNRVLIIVKDTGHGIPEKDLPHIFEPFFTTKDERFGVGLGLSTVFGIMEHHNGTVHVESMAGEGSKFTIELPLSESASEG